MYVTSYGIHEFDEGRIHLEPIKLTEEWLLKFGFRYYQNAYYAPDEEEYFIINTKYGFNFISFSEVDGSEWAIKFDIKYVHQLQNLYYTLTGKELEINEQNTI